MPCVQIAVILYTSNDYTVRFVSMESDFSDVRRSMPNVQCPITTVLDVRVYCMILGHNAVTRHLYYQQRIRDLPKGRGTIGIWGKNSQQGPGAELFKVAES